MIGGAFVFGSAFEPVFAASVRVSVWTEYRADAVRTPTFRVDEAGLGSNLERDVVDIVSHGTPLPLCFGWNGEKVGRGKVHLDSEELITPTIEPYPYTSSVTNLYRWLLWN